MWSNANAARRLAASTTRTDRLRPTRMTRAGSDQTPQRSRQSDPRRRGRPARSRTPRTRRSQYFGEPTCASLGRADIGELFTPLESVARQSGSRARAVITPGPRGPGVGAARSQAAGDPAQARPGGVTDIDIQPDAITLWIDCEQPLNVRILRFQPADGRPADVRRQAAPEARSERRPPSLPPMDEQCPHCFEPVRKGADFCPACGRHIGPKPKRSKKFWIILALIILLLLLLLCRRDHAAHRRRGAATGAEAQADGDRGGRDRARPRPTADRSAASPAPAGRARRRARSRSGVSGGGDLRVHVLTDGDGPSSASSTPRTRRRTREPSRRASASL